MLLAMGILIISSSIAMIVLMVMIGIAISGHISRTKSIRKKIK